MNITSLTGMSPGAVPQMIPSQPAKQNAIDGELSPQLEKEKVDSARKTEQDKEQEKEKQKASKVKPEDLVLKPTPTSFEERMNQIISEKEVKDILSLVTGAPIPKDEEHKVDVKR